MYKLKLGTSVVFFEKDGKIRADYEKELDEIQRLGFDAVDFDITGVWLHDSVRRVLPDLIIGLEAIKTRGLILNAVHMPFQGWWDYADENEELRRQTVELSIEIMQVAKSYQPKCYIFHGNNSNKEPSITPEARMKTMSILRRSIQSLVAATEAKVCVEILPRHGILNNSAEAINFIDEIPGGRICCDVNHFLKEKSEDAVLALGNRIATLHISDHDYINERHLLPKYGKIDWMKLIGALEKIGYDGVFSYEVAMQYGGYVFFTFADIKRNYDELFDEYNALKISSEENCKK